MSDDLAREEAERRWTDLHAYFPRREVHDAFIAGAAWKAAQPPTDAEVEAAARAYGKATGADWWDPLVVDLWKPEKVEQERQYLRERIRFVAAALTAAREVRS